MRTCQLLGAAGLHLGHAARNSRHAAAANTHTHLHFQSSRSSHTHTHLYLQQPLTHTHFLLQHELSNTYLHLCYWLTLLFITYYGLMCRSILEAVGKHEATCLYLHQFTTCGFLISPVCLSVYSLSLFVSIRGSTYDISLTCMHIIHGLGNTYQSRNLTVCSMLQSPRPTCYSNKYTGSTWGQNQKK